MRGRNQYTDNPVPFEQRFLSHVQKTDSCWLWIGSKIPNGYGQTNIGSRNALAHRASYELFKGPIPKGMFVCHTCDNPGCVNP